MQPDSIRLAGLVTRLAPSRSQHSPEEPDTGANTQQVLQQPEVWQTAPLTRCRTSLGQVRLGQRPEEQGRASLKIAVQHGACTEGHGCQAQRRRRAATGRRADAHGGGGCADAAAVGRRAAAGQAQVCTPERLRAERQAARFPPGKPLAVPQLAARGWRSHSLELHLSEHVQSAYNEMLLHFTCLTCTVRVQVPVPQNRLTPLKESWLKLYQPVTEHMQLDMRMNIKTKKVGCPNVARPDPKRLRHEASQAVDTVSHALLVSIPSKVTHVKVAVISVHRLRSRL